MTLARRMGLKAMGKGNDSAFRTSNASLRQLAQNDIHLSRFFVSSSDREIKTTRIECNKRLRCSALTNVRLFI